MASAHANQESTSRTFASGAVAMLAALAVQLAVTGPAAAASALRAEPAAERTPCLWLGVWEYMADFSELPVLAGERSSAEWSPSIATIQIETAGDELLAAWLLNLPPPAVR